MGEKLSVLIITLNEEKHLGKCLQSVKEIADEVIVVDSGSTDKTVKIAKEFGARVFYRKFDNFANQKNYALSKAKFDWILSLDADEVISKELSQEIKEELKDPKFDAYTIPRKNIILGRFIRFTRWQPELDRHIWLWKRGRGRWKGLVHEEVLVEGSVGRLKNPKIHYQYETISEFLQMMDKYSEIEAEEKLKNGIGFSYFRFFFDPIYNFLVRFFYRLGFLDGVYGFILSFLMAIYHLEVWIKVWEKENVKKD